MKPADIATGLREVVSRLDSSNFEYMIVGSVAATIYGEPRLTNDLDLVISMSSLSCSELVSSFPAAEFYVPPLEIMSQEITRSGQINLIHHQSGVKVDVMFRKNTPHAVAEFDRRSRFEILTGLHAWIAAPEDIIIAKLRFFREGGSEKHLSDIRGILANTQVNRDYLNAWLVELELSRFFAKV